MILKDAKTIHALIEELKDTEEKLDNFANDYVSITGYLYDSSNNAFPFKWEKGSSEYNAIIKFYREKIETIKNIIDE